MPGAGKSLVSEYLQALGWGVVYFGGLTMEHLDARGMERTPANEKIIREELRRQFGPDAFARLRLEQIRQSLVRGPTVIDGLYSWAEYLFLKNNLPGPMFVCAMAPPRALRYQRLAARPIRPLTPQQAQDRDFAEIENLDKGGPIAIADFTIVNDGSQQELRKAIDIVLNRIASSSDHEAS